MASARSTVSIARTTPAQKPRGEHSITFNGGFAEGLRSLVRGGVVRSRRRQLRRNPVQRFGNLLLLPRHRIDSGLTELFVIGRC